MTTKPVMPSQGACRLFLPWASSSPSDGEPGGRPKPRKSSEVSAVMPPIRMNGMKVSVATMALGRMCRSMMVKLPTPSARAARTKSKLRARRNSARTTPTSAVQANSSRRPSSHQKFGVDHAGQDDQQVEGRHRGPDLDEALEQQIDPAAEIALHGAGERRRPPSSGGSAPGRTGPRCGSRRSPGRARRAPGRRCRAVAAGSAARAPARAGRGPRCRSCRGSAARASSPCSSISSDRTGRCSRPRSGNRRRRWSPDRRSRNGR